MGKLTTGKDNVERSIRPFHELYDGTTSPFGKKKEDGIFHLIYHTTSRHGYERLPIWATTHEHDGAWHTYQIFVGEAPHKDENGKWVTYNEVPTFILGAFGGADFIDKEPDIPHLIDIQTDEMSYERDSRLDAAKKEMYDECMKTKHDMYYCTLGTYFRGLGHRFSRRFGEFTKHTGKRYKYISWHKSTKQGYISLSIFKKLDRSEIYLQKETGDWVDFLYLKRDGRLCFEHEKHINDQVCSEC